MCFPGLLACGLAAAQVPTPPAPAPDEPAPAPHGQILIQSHGTPPDIELSSPETTQEDAHLAPPGSVPAVTDADRSALAVIRYDLDARIQPDRAGLAVRARLQVRNNGTEPLKVLPLQISSTLHWESATLLGTAGNVALPLQQHRLDTDLDHTGAASEAVLTLSEPLAPGAMARLDLFYSGTVRQSAGRLERLGASAAQGHDTDWDEISARWTGLRGYGNVLWYPVASPQLFLADGNTLFRAVGALKLRDEAVPVHLQLSVAYSGEPPEAAYFCGRRMTLHALADQPDAPLANGTGLATADFPEQALGFRTPSLFVIAQPEQMVVAGPHATPVSPAAPAGESSSNAEVPVPALQRRPDPSAAPAEEPLVAFAPTDAEPEPGVGTGLAAAADQASALLKEWLGPRPLSALTVLDHTGQPFQDGPLLVAPAATLETSPEQPALVYSLTHAWVQTGQPWMDDGLAQYFALLTVERNHGRAEALQQLHSLMQPVALLEPDSTTTGADSPGQPLINASDEVFYRRKAAAVWWMLRDVAGEQPLRAALAAWRTQPITAESSEVQAVAFETLLERLSGKDLRWFFADWVLADRGLPNLSITGVQTSQTQAGPGHPAGWLLAVTVKNDGGAGADVPMVVRSGQASTSSTLHIAGLSEATQRVVLQAPPTEVTVNDGSVPEIVSSVHTREISVHTEP